MLNLRDVSENTSIKQTASNTKLLKQVNKTIKKELLRPLSTIE